MDYLILPLAGLVAGMIDAIAGGGGLILLPLYTIIVGAGPDAIGTNKVCGFVGAIVALFVYARHSPGKWKATLPFALWVGASAFLGSHVATYVPREWFKWILLATCPLMLWVVLRKNLWVADHQRDLKASVLNPKKALIFGLMCGFYDGVWGPGGGTLMFLALFIALKMPLLEAISGAKLANTFSALASVARFSMGGYVHLSYGLVGAIGMCCGAFLGAHFATRKGAAVVRPVLVVLVVLLLCRVLI